MIVERWSPPPGSPLCSLVESIWYFDGPTGAGTEPVFPDGVAELIVQLDDVYRDGDNGSVPFAAVCVNGLRTRPNLLEPPGKRCRVLGIAFSPIGACLAFEQPVRELLDVTVDLRVWAGERAHELAERCDDALRLHRASGPEGAKAAIEAAAQWAGRRLDEPQDPAWAGVRWTAERIRAASGSVSLEWLRAQTGVGRSDFARRFRQAVGVTPKRYARILRFHRALRLISAGRALSRVAHDLAYFDQSHMHRDFAEFAGATPATFAAAGRFPQSVHLAEG